MGDVPVPMVEELIKAVYEAGGFPIVNIWNQRIERDRRRSKRSVAEGMGGCGHVSDETADVFIGIRGVANVRNSPRFPTKQLLPFILQTGSYGYPVPETRWVVQASHRGHGPFSQYGNVSLKIFLYGVYRCRLCGDGRRDGGG